VLAAIYETGPNVGFVFIAIVAVAVPVMAIIDTLVWPARAFYGAGSNKTAWVIVLVGATVLGIGVFLGAWYLLGVRPKVKQWASRLAPGRW
jgi:hypothetical protein